jgi:FkbM family methyltransferase
MLMPISNFGIKPRGILHLGANTGEEADLYDALHPELVVWFECNPRSLPFLHMNVAHRPGHHVMTCAVSNVDGEAVDFHITNNDASSSILPLKEHLSAYPDVTEDKVIKVITHRVDGIIFQNGWQGKFDFVNLDLQGAELIALQGMEKTLQDDIKWVYTEVNYKELYEGCALMEDISKYLAKFGFEVFRVCDTNCGWGDAIYKKKGVL